MEQSIVSNDLETVMTITKWVVGILTPIILGLAAAIYQLWKRNIDLQDKLREEMKEMWQLTLDAFKEQERTLATLTERMEKKDAK